MRSTTVAGVAAALCVVLQCVLADDRARTGQLSDSDFQVLRFATLVPCLPSGGTLRLTPACIAQVMYGDVLVNGEMLGKAQTNKAPHIAG